LLDGGSESLVPLLVVSRIPSQSVVSHFIWGKPLYYLINLHLYWRLATKWTAKWC